MRHILSVGVIAMTLAVSAAALAETGSPTPAPAKDGPTAPFIAAPTAASPPVVASTTAASAPVVAVVQAPKPTVAAVVAPVRAPAPVPAPTTAMTSAAAPSAPAVASAAPTSAPAVVPAPASVAPAAAKEPEPPLALRPPAPLTLASEPPSTPWGYKLLFGAAIVAAGVLVWRKRRALATTQKASTPVRILGKTSMGLRGELALVEVGGMRVLVGITPSSMQTLAVLPDDDAEVEEIAEERARSPERRSSSAPAAGASNRSELASRARSLFSSIDVGPPIPPRVAVSGFAASRYADARDSDAAPDSAPATRAHMRERETDPPPREREANRLRRAARDMPLEGQARGIALALGNRK